MGPYNFSHRNSAAAKNKPTQPLSKPRIASAGPFVVEAAPGRSPERLRSADLRASASPVCIVNASELDQESAFKCAVSDICLGVAMVGLLTAAAEVGLGLGGGAMSLFASSVAKIFSPAWGEYGFSMTASLLKTAATMLPPTIAVAGFGALGHYFLKMFRGPTR